MASDGAMEAWFNGLSDRDREDLCDAYEHNDYLSQELVDTFPDVGEPRPRGGWVTLAHQAAVAGASNTSQYRMTDRLREFLGQSHRCRG